MPLLLSATSSYLGVRGPEREEERREREREREGEEEGGGNKTCIIVSALQVKVLPGHFSQIKQIVQYSKKLTAVPTMM